jgi:hypothetical protein
MNALMEGGPIGDCLSPFPEPLPDLFRGFGIESYQLMPSRVERAQRVTRIFHIDKREADCEDFEGPPRAPGHEG